MNLQKFVSGLWEMIKENGRYLIIAAAVIGGLVVLSVLTRLLSKISERASGDQDMVAGDVPVKAAEGTAFGRIAPEVVAAIAAAVASLDDGCQYAIRGITPAKARTRIGRSAWRMAGLLDQTRPF